MTEPAGPVGAHQQGKDPMRKTCTVDGCSKKSVARGLCPMHYQRWRTGREMTGPPGWTFNSTTCKTTGCDNRPRSHDLCDAHYRRFRRYGDPEAISSRTDKECAGPGCLTRVALTGKYCSRCAQQNRAGCTVADCDRVAVARGYCAGHLQRVRTHGDPLADKPLRVLRGGPRNKYPSLEAALAGKTGAPDERGCQAWEGTLNALGYGQLGYQGRSWLAHRAAYEVANGVTLRGDQVIHHKCANRSCVAPEHLQITDRLSNTAEMLERQYYQQRIRELEAQLAAAQRKGTS